jgi:Outer membrane protein
MSRSLWRRVLLGSVVATLFIAPAGSQESDISSLQSLWRALWSSSGKVASDEAQISADSAQGRLARNSYYPTLKASSGRTQTASVLEDEGSWFGDWSAEASVVEAIPGGAVLSVSGADTVSDIDFYDARRHLQYPSISADFSQSLSPFWLEKGGRDPILEGPRLKISESELGLRKTRRDLALETAKNYISLRSAEREVSYLEQGAVCAEEELKSKKEQQANGTLSIRDGWAGENALWSIKKQLLEARATAAELRQALFQSTGLRIGDVASLALPSLPVVSRQGTALEAELLSVALQQERCALVAQRQKAAPTVELGFKRAFVERPTGWDTAYDASYSLTMKNYWSASLSLSFPSSFFSDVAIESDLERAYERKHKSLLNEQSREIASRRELYVIHEAGLDEQRSGAQAELSRLESSVSDAEALKKKGQISELDLWRNRLDAVRARGDVENIEDQLWLTRLYLASLDGWAGEESE